MKQVGRGTILTGSCGVGKARPGFPNYWLCSPLCYKPSGQPATFFITTPSYTALIKHRPMFSSLLQYSILLHPCLPFINNELQLKLFPLRKFLPVMGQKHCPRTKNKIKKGEKKRKYFQLYLQAF